MQLFAGTSGFSYKEWLGPLLSGEASRRRDAALLRASASRRSRSTTRSTACRPSDARAVVASRCPENFTFTLKAPRRITHDKRLREAESHVAEFLRRAGALGRQARRAAVPVAAVPQEGPAAPAGFPRPAAARAGGSPSSFATTRGRTTRSTRRCAAAARCCASPTPTKATRRSSPRPTAATSGCGARTTTTRTCAPGSSASPRSALRAHLRLLHA